MNILWITNVEMPEIANYFGRKIVVGGWMNKTSLQLSMRKDIKLTIACPCAIKEDVYSNITIKNICYYAFFKEDAYNSIYDIIRNVEPTCIHIWGTEYSHSYSAVCAAEELGMLDRTIVSIQGLVSVYARHYTYGLPEKIVKGRTFKELLGRPNIEDAQRNMEKQGEIEIQTLKKVKYCIGRTDWDYACTKQINSGINYFFCNETLRDGFYRRKWEYAKCKKHSIFFSQAHYPVKGLHHLMEALSIVRAVYPDTEVHIVGNDFLKMDGLKSRLKMSSYQKYLLTLQKEYMLEECMIWEGMLSEAEMIEQFCKANVFVCASNIENSSNSIGEAMLLGVPIVASDVGGVKSLLVHDYEGMLYQESAPYMLAQCIMELFKDSQKAITLGKNARRRAILTHDEDKNLECLVKIYNQLIKEYSM